MSVSLSQSVGAKPLKCCIPHCKSKGAKAIFSHLLELPPHEAKLISYQKYLDTGAPYICENHYVIRKQEDVTQAPEYMFTVPCRDYLPETFGELSEAEDYNDFVIDLSLLKQQYVDRLGKYLDRWSVVEYSEFVLFFLLEAADIPKIRFSIRIEQDLQLSVALDGRLMDPLDYTGFVPISGRLTRWSQLEAMLIYYCEKTFYRDRISNIQFTCI